MSLSDSVDIVVLNCNNKGYIEDCINSIRLYTTGRFNLIVIDQNSKDGSREWLIEKDVASHLILNGENKGCAKAKNQGIRAGRYPWIVFIDSDMEIKDKTWLDKIWNYTIDRRVGFIEARVQVRKQSKGESDATPCHDFAKMSFCMIRRQCLNEIGYFDRDFQLCEDDEWFYRFEFNDWWKHAWCYDTNVFHHGRKTKDGCLKNHYEEIESYNTQVRAEAKYGEMYHKVIRESEINRMLKRKELLSWVEENG